MSMEEESKSDVKLKNYIQWEKEIQQKWEEKKMCKQVGSANWSDESRKKFFSTFPYKSDKLNSNHLLSSFKCGKSENDLEQMTIDELEKMQMELKINVETKKDELFNQLTIQTRLKERLTKIFESIENNQERIKEFLENDTQILTSGDLFDDLTDRWNKDEKMINDKFELIDQLLNELNI